MAQKHIPKQKLDEFRKLAGILKPRFRDELKNEKKSGADIKQFMDPKDQVFYAIKYGGLKDTEMYSVTTMIKKRVDHFKAICKAYRKGKTHQEGLLHVRDYTMRNLPPKPQLNWRQKIKLKWLNFRRKFTKKKTLPSFPTKTNLSGLPSEQMG